MAAAPPSSPDHVPADALAARLGSLLQTAHRQWISPAERRRMRAFGFRPAVEPGVLKREWHGLAVRVSDIGVRAARPGAGELAWVAQDGTLLLDGEPYGTAGGAIDVVENLLDLIAAYERWVEAREGREERIERGRQTRADRRPVNALAETRRLQRMLQAPGRRRA